MKNYGDGRADEIKFMSKTYRNYSLLNINYSLILAMTKFKKRSVKNYELRKF